MLKFTDLLFSGYGAGFTNYLWSIKLFESYVIYEYTSTQIRTHDSKNISYVQVILLQLLNPLKTKRRLLYLKTHFVPRSKHFSSRL